ncbi:RND transporter [Brevundimonas sp. LM2]|uniref:efflux RND transporter permease subunit n=1 Tax=Brevundimonas sp. LM2 TaxID=1938605 RepID=UPI000983E6D5|nr:efflux RND transporter permease subunit [Brevundimonas sp. LM2]AQR63058.1 RND transporter [Brevundimonas sp. LM2]
MNLATWSIRNPVPVILLFVLLALAGWRGFTQLSIQNLPDLDLPSVTVSLSQPGAAPSQLETEVARRVENSIATLAGLEHIRTSITDGRVQIMAQFALEKPLSEALAETKDAVDRVRTDLPQDLQPPIVTAVTIAGGPILTYSVAAAGLDEEALSWLVDDEVAKAILAVPGVGQFERVGGVQREIRVEVDPVRLAGVNATAAEVSRALRDTQQESSGGRTQVGGGEQAIRTVATAAQASDLARMPIVLADGRSLRLDQVAEIRDTIGDRTQAAMLDGTPVVGFNIFRAKGADETRVAQGVAEALAALQAEDPRLSVTPIDSSVDYTLEQYHGSMQMLIEGALLAVLVVFLFLRDWRATLIAAAALPLSILPTFAVMDWFGFSLNTVTLLALAVIVGILVDDAVVEIENIERHRRMGKPAVQAAGDAVTEIALAVMATTLTLVVVFVPTALMSGIPGLFFRQFGWTAVIAVMASLLVARLLTPLMAAYLLGASRSRTERDGAVMRRYLAAVRWCLAHRGATLAAALALFIGSVALVPLIPTGLIPPADRGSTSVNIELPPGSAFEETRAVAEAVRRSLSGLDGVASTFTAIGTAQGGGDGPSAAEVRRATVTLKLRPRGERPAQAEIETAVRTAVTAVPGARFTVGGGPGAALSLILASDDAQALTAAARAFEHDLRTVPGLSNVASTASLERPEVVVRPDLARAAERGVSTAAIGETVRIATSGDFDRALAKLNLDNRQIPIRVRMTDVDRSDPDALARLRVPSSGGSTPLGDIATLSLENGPAQIDRYDRQRQMTLNADLGGTPLGRATSQAMALPAAVGLPTSVHLIQSGDGEIAGELASGFIVAIVTGILCMFCILILLFRDVLQPLTILSAIPLAMGGAFVALLVAGSELDVPAMIGLVMLTGIVTKNSILLVEYAVVSMRERELPMVDALVDACHKRARPIIMTSVAMIAGMLPVAIGLGADASFRQPMATAVIGGLVTSTLLSLLVVPVVFSVTAGVERRLARLFRAPVIRTRHAPDPKPGETAP